MAGLLGLEAHDYKAECEQSSHFVASKLNHLYQLYSRLVSTKGNLCELDKACYSAAGEEFGEVATYLEVHCNILADVLRALEATSSNLENSKLKKIIEEEIKIARSTEAFDRKLNELSRHPDLEQVNQTYIHLKKFEDIQELQGQVEESRKKLDEKKSEANTPILLYRQQFINEKSIAVKSQGYRKSFKKLQDELMSAIQVNRPICFPAVWGGTEKGCTAYIWIELIELAMERRIELAVPIMKKGVEEAQNKPKFYKVTIFNLDVSRDLHHAQLSAFKEMPCCMQFNILESEMPKYINHLMDCRLWGGMPGLSKAQALDYIYAYSLGQNSLGQKRRIGLNTENRLLSEVRQGRGNGLVKGYLFCLRSRIGDTFYRKLYLEMLIAVFFKVKQANLSQEILELSELTERLKAVEMVFSKGLSSAEKGRLRAILGAESKDKGITSFFQASPPSLRNMPWSPISSPDLSPLWAPVCKGGKRASLSDIFLPPSCILSAPGSEAVSSDELKPPMMDARYTQRPKMRKEALGIGSYACPSRDPRRTKNSIQAAAKQETEDSDEEIDDDIIVGSPPVSYRSMGGNED